MSMQPPASVPKEKPPTQCSFCDMSFKKLEHAQRHERTHTLDRPYTCATCGKTFARQDTLNRHARLHNRTKDEAGGSRAPSSAPAVAGAANKNRKRRSSVSSVTSGKGKQSVSPPAGSHQQLQASPSFASQAMPMAIENAGGASTSNAGSSSSSMPFSLSLPVTIPSFPAYSRPVGDAVSAFAHPSHARRHSDAAYASLLGGIHLDLRASAIAEDPFAPLSTSVETGGFHHHNPHAAAGPFELNPHQLHQPSSFGYLSGGGGATQHSPLSVDDSSSSSSGDADSPGSSYTTVDQYPSPAYSSYSPSTLHDTMADLEAILANDPLHASMTANRRPSLDACVASTNPATLCGPATSLQTSLGFGDSIDFDFDSFAASVEGDAPTSTAAAPINPNVSFESLLNASRPAEAAYPTPASAHPALTPLPPLGGLDFDFPEYALHSAPASTRALPTPAQKTKSLPSFSSLTMPSSTIDAMSLLSNAPVLPQHSQPQHDPIASAYSTTFPSLSVMPNGLGLHDSSPSILYDAYLKRKPSPSNGGGHALMSSSAMTSPAFYIPSEQPRNRLAVSMPSWSPLGRETVESREPGAFVAI